jgi:hypothetical protein
MRIASSSGELRSRRCQSLPFMYLILFFTIWFAVFNDRINHFHNCPMFAVGKRSLLKNGCEKGGYWVCIDELSCHNTDIFIGLEIERCFREKNAQYCPNSHICPIGLTCYVRSKASLLAIFMNVFTKGLSHNHYPDISSPADIILAHSSCKTVNFSCVCVRPLRVIELSAAAEQPVHLILIVFRGFSVC